MRTLGTLTIAVAALVGVGGASTAQAEQVNGLSDVVRLRGADSAAQSTPAPKFPAVKPVGIRFHTGLQVMVPVLLSDESRALLPRRLDRGYKCLGRVGSFTKANTFLWARAQTVSTDLKRRGKQLPPAVLRAWAAFAAQGPNAMAAICQYDWESNYGVANKTLRGTIVVGGFPAEGAFPAIPAARKAFSFKICHWFGQDFKSCRTPSYQASR